LSSTGKTSETPHHVAIIMDGNGRWAKAHGLPRLKGHQEGANSVIAIIRACKEAGVKYLTLYAFSVENWIRPKSEIRGLMKLLQKFLHEREEELHQNNIRLRIIGQLQDLPKPIQDELRRVMKATESYDEGHLILALSYGGRTEITRATKEIAQRVKDGTLDPEEVDEETVAQHLYAPDVPDPDLLIRTSGEVRVSNFLLWQISYAELYFTDTMWPDFREPDFMKALEEFGQRRRRYGDIE